MKVTLVKDENEEIVVTTVLTGRQINSLATAVYTHRLLGLFDPEEDAFHGVALAVFKGLIPVIGDRKEGSIE